MSTPTKTVEQVKEELAECMKDSLGHKLSGQNMVAVSERVHAIVSQLYCAPKFKVAITVDPDEPRNIHIEVTNTEQKETDINIHPDRVQMVADRRNHLADSQYLHEVDQDTLTWEQRNNKVTYGVDDNVNKK